MNKTTNTKFINFTKEDIEKANSIDIENFLRSRGEKCIKSGRDKRLISDNSITIRGNKWYDHSKKVGGYTIEFIKMYYNIDFLQAMILLIGNNTNYDAYEKEEIIKNEFKLPPKNKDNKRIIYYMTKHRGINSSVLMYFINQRLIYESYEKYSNNRIYHNIIFVGLDKSGQAKHAQKRSIYTSKRFVKT